MLQPRNFRKVFGIGFVVSFVFQQCWAWKVRQPVPSISLDGYALADNPSSFITNLTDIPLGLDSNDTMIIVPSSVRGLSLICNASYPVEFRFHRDKWNQRTLFQTWLVNSRGSDPNTLEPLWFAVELRFIGYNNEITGNYTCQKYGESTLSSSVFVFWEGSSPPFLTLISSGTHKRTVHLEDDLKSFILPCTVSRPDISVQLLKEDGNSTKDMTNLEQVHFDPAIGFTVVNVPNPEGVYRCMAGSPEDEDSLDFQVVPYGPSTPEFNDTRIGKAHFEYNSTKRQFVCCSGSAKPPKIGHYYCTHPTTCQLQKHALHKLESPNHKSTQNNCAFFPLWALAAGVLRCKGDQIDLVREYFFPTLSPRDMYGRTNVSAISPYFSWSDANPVDMILFTYSSEPFYIGQKRNFMCRPSAFYYSRGVHWTIVYNDTKVTVKANMTSGRRNHTYSIMQNGPATMSLVADAGLKELWCHAPIWNTTEWGVKKLIFDIQKPNPSAINGSVMEDITFPTDSKDRILTCNFSGTPVPKVRWFRNDRPLLRRPGQNYSLIKTTGLSSQLNISRFQSGGAIYKCNVSNVGGNATKTFRVVISDGIPVGKVVCGVFGGLFLTILCGGLILAAMWKMRQQQEKIRKLANVAFKDVNDVVTATTPASEPPRYDFPNSNGNGINNPGLHRPFPGNSEGNPASEFGRYQKM